jgi:hypothetical protein
LSRGSGDEIDRRKHGGTALAERAFIEKKMMDSEGRFLVPPALAGRHCHKAVTERT